MELIKMVKICQKRKKYHGIPMCTMFRVVIVFTLVMSCPCRLDNAPIRWRLGQGDFIQISNLSFSYSFISFYLFKQIYPFVKRLNLFAFHCLLCIVWCVCVFGFLFQVGKNSIVWEIFKAQNDQQITILLWWFFWMSFSLSFAVSVNTCVDVVVDDVVFSHHSTLDFEIKCPHLVFVWFD